jgi:putative transposase
MARTARASRGGICYHVINRGNGRARVFHDDADYRQFLRLMERTSERLAMRVLAYCLMPNHFHLVLWPLGDGDLSRWMQGLMTAQVRRHHKRHGTDGHLWQGRFKAFPIQHDDHLLTVLRYVERNPLRAGLVERARDWPWSSLGPRPVVALHKGPVPRPASWRRWVERAESPDELAELRTCVTRERPWGSRQWVARTAPRLGLEASLRPLGRPPKTRVAGKARIKKKK